MKYHGETHNVNYYFVPTGRAEFLFGGERQAIVDRRDVGEMMVVGEMPAGVADQSHVEARQ
ncbi:hypothetical protein [Halarchaeum salinum]|uniref:Cupin domain-containing protein n=1 Tax=Halarchaeum salinum TaxID=489912 RepID=A0AAV3S7T0_9EURY